MGNVAAIDIGIVVLRCTIFDRHNDLFPYQVIKQRQKMSQPDLTNAASLCRFQPHFFVFVNNQFFSKAHSLKCRGWCKWADRRRNWVKTLKKGVAELFHGGLFLLFERAWRNIPFFAV